MSDPIQDPRLAPSAAAPATAVASRDPMRAAMLRLAASRAQLHGAMMPKPRQSFASARAAQGAQGLDAAAWLAAAREYISQWRLPKAALDAVERIWAHHPVREGGELLLDEANRLVVPVIRRHPFAAVALAAGAGAAIYVARPWRWLAGPLRAMPRDASRWVTHQISQPAVQTAIVGFLMTQLGRRKSGGTASTEKPSGASAAAQPPSAPPQTDAWQEAQRQQQRHAEAAM